MVIKYDKKFIKKEISEIKNIIPFLVKNNIKYYFPFKNDVSVIDLDKHIAKTEKKCNPKKMKIILKNKINNIKNIIDKKLEINANDKYVVYLNFYGPDGYYYAPNVIVVNIFNKTTEYILETIIHEYVHLLLEAKKIKFSYIKNEKLVDDIIYKLLRDALPNYKRQF